MHPHAARRAPGAGCRSGCATRSRCSPCSRWSRSALAIVAARRRRGADSASQRGTGAGHRSSATPAGHQGRLGPRASAHAYDPLGDDERALRPGLARRRPRRRAPPGRPRATTAGIEGAGKPGVGIYVDAKPQGRRRRDADRRRRSPAGRRRSTPRPPGPVPDSRARTAGRRSAAAPSTASDKRFKLDTGGTALPLLPRLDHQARRRAPSAPRSPRSGSSQESRGLLRRL